eukprot:CAMPEP_0175575230 /NCGR_PEP_ID=MMETSP0096-20121207/44457_1 /TAXON_ID=311494 /ORGANISM="Alexandrium monilatum, Strain CCMP3105" /LENGTH=281 /DNA_ID=CAMNT_0016878751 /DNA_START=74 /DNA_END=916 /DNA_ORIENTATION=-
MATRKMRAITLCLLPTLMCAEILAEPLCNTGMGGYAEASAKPPGQSVLQKTSDLREHSLSVWEMEDELGPLEFKPHGSLPIFVDCAHICPFLGCQIHGHQEDAGNHALVPPRADVLGDLGGALCSTGTDGNDQACAKPLGQSVLQKTSDMREHSLNVWEMEDGSSSEACWWHWLYGSGSGSSSKNLGSAKSRDQCQRMCKLDSESDRTVNGCSWDRRTCSALRGMNRIIHSPGTESAYIPCASVCTRTWSWHVGKGDGRNQKNLGSARNLYECSMKCLQEA